VCAGILPPQARARTCTPNSAKARMVHSPVHIPEQERLSRGTGPWSRTLPSPRHGRRGQFVTYPHCEINCGGGIGACRDVSGRVVAVDAHQHRQLAVTPRRETVRVGDRCRLNPVTRRRRPRPLHRTALPLTLLPAPMRRLQLFDLVEHRALTRVDARLASLDQIRPCHPRETAASRSRSTAPTPCHAERPRPPTSPRRRPREQADTCLQQRKQKDVPRTAPFTRSPTLTLLPESVTRET